MTSSITPSKSVMIEDFSKFSWRKKDSEVITYSGVINFERAGKKEARHCVMCGLPEDGDKCVIPNQNKDVCRKCDSCYWLLKEFNVVIKFCKGCKTFFALMNYDEKPEASKCGTCRRRGRDNYHHKKKMRCEGSSSPQEFCSFVNSMPQDADEVLDVQTLLEYVSGSEFELENFSFHADAMYVPADLDEGGLMTMSKDSDDDREMEDLFTSTWLPELSFSS